MKKKRVVKTVKTKWKTRYTKVRSYGKRAGGWKGGIIPPVLGGAADGFINPMSPVNGIGSLAVGWFMHDEWTKKNGLWQIGASLPALIGVGKSGGAYY